MTLKEVILPSENERVELFLSECGLRYERADKTLYFEDGDKIAGTVSVSGNVIKCLAVDEEYRNENLAAKLVGEMINRLHSEGVYHYHVFTKPAYAALFENLGFKPLVTERNFAALEGGEGDINGAVSGMLVKMKFGLGIEGGKQNDVGCIVLNGNPFTTGHLKLAEHVAAAHKFALVFVLEEEGSYFSFKERYAMAYLALKPLSNVLVLPSSEYIVSKATFPGYFLKSADDATREYAKYDALIFKKYFMPGLGIRKRYVGSETSDYMKIYNSVLAETLGDKLEILPRFEEDGKVISAKFVRGLIEEGNVDEALKYIPRNNYAVFKSILGSKRHV